MGDAVNLASRLEGINKLFGSRILISEFTRESAIAQTDNNDEGFFTRELGKFVVKGKAKAVSVFELVDFERNITPEKRELKERYETALKYFYEKNFLEAEKIFTELKEQKEDKASEFMLSQIEYLRENPPPISWDGEIALMVK
jgi:adenylate cyclase